MVLQKISATGTKILILTGILDCAAYVGAFVQPIFFGSVLTNSGNWNLVFLCIVGVLCVMVIAALLAGIERKRDMR